MYVQWSIVHKLQATLLCRSDLCNLENIRDMYSTNLATERKGYCTYTIIIVCEQQQLLKLWNFWNIMLLVSSKIPKKSRARKSKKYVVHVYRTDLRNTEVSQHEVITIDEISAHFSKNSFSRTYFFPRIDPEKLIFGKHLFLIFFSEYFSPNFKNFSKKSTFFILVSRFDPALTEINFFRGAVIVFRLCSYSLLPYSGVLS